MSTVWCVVLFGAAISLVADSPRLPTLWNDPGPISSLDLAGGPGGRADAPQPPFVFHEALASGTTPKIIVTDARRAQWTVKFGEETKSETFATRIAWAAGYFAEPTYFVPEGKIDVVGYAGRAAQFLNNGHFRDARFELYDITRIHYLPGKQWSLTDSALQGTRELSGLKLLFTLLGNWDIKPENMSIVEMNGRRWYAVTDWGATMGRAGDFTGRSKWNCQDYTAQSENFLQGVENGFVEVRFDGKDRNEVLRGIKLEHLQWFVERMGKISNSQLNAALLASGATSDEAECFLRAFRTRLDQLASAETLGADGVVTRTRREIRVIRKQTRPE